MCDDSRLVPGRCRQATPDLCWQYANLLRPESAIAGEMESFFSPEGGHKPLHHIGICFSLDSGGVVVIVHTPKMSDGALGLMAAQAVHFGLRNVEWPFEHVNVEFPQMHFEVDLSRQVKMGRDQTVSKKSGFSCPDSGCPDYHRVIRKTENLLTIVIAFYFYKGMNQLLTNVIHYNEISDLYV